MERTRQAVSVFVALVGPQETRVSAHRPGTDGAAVSVRVGGALLYMLDAATVSCFTDTWNGMAREARALPPESDPTKAKAVRGMTEPAVMVQAANSPTVFARLERPIGQSNRVLVTLGRITFDVRDLSAFHSTAIAFRRAEQAAATAFLPASGSSARERAAQTAARAFGPAGTRRRVPPAAARPAVRIGRANAPSYQPSAERTVR